MRKNWSMRVLAPVAAAAMLAACTSEVGDRASDNKAENDKGGSRTQKIALKGCVEAGPGDEYILRHVQMQPLPTQPSDAPSSTGLSITEGSWVRLKMNDADPLKNNIGKTVAVVGTISDTGQNTIGTAGDTRAPDESEPRTDPSQAATSEHHSEKVRKEAGPLGQQGMWNGSVPQMSVERVDATGQACDTRATTGRQ